MENNKIKSINESILYRLYKEKKLADDYNFSLQLANYFHTAYIKNDDVMEYKLIKIIGTSKLDNNICLMPKQLEILSKIKNTNKAVISAPTSFGKTFLMLEYIKRNIDFLNKVIYVVHTKSLKEELLLKMNVYFYGKTKILDDFESIKEYDKFLCVIISDGQNIYDADIDIDLLVIDEAYNLNKEHSETRYFLIINSYKHLMKKAKKIYLIGPFISRLIGEEANDYKLIKSDYSPVIQNIIEGDTLKELNKSPLEMFAHLILKYQSTIAFINSKNDIYKTLYDLLEKNIVDFNDDSFIKYLENNFPDFWIVPQMLRRGVAIYHSAFPRYVNHYCLNKFNNKSNIYGLITTSAILEGVNTSAKNLVIFKTTYNEKSMTPFQFFNLCGRIGRLGKEILGTVYNYGDEYNKRLEDKRLPLFIGNSDLTDDYEKVDEGIKNIATEKIIDKIKNLLKEINIDYDIWYEKNLYYFNGSKNLLEIIEVYMKFRIKLLTFMNNEDEFTNEGKINKIKLLKHIYEGFVSEIKQFKYKTNSSFVHNIVLEKLLQSHYGGINLNLKKFCSNNLFLFKDKNKKDLTEIEKNIYFSEIMKYAYDYIPNKLYKASYLLKEFIENDIFFDLELKEEFNCKFYIRVITYLEGNNGIIGKKLNEIGLLPSSIDKLINNLKLSNINYDRITKSDLTKYIKENYNNFGLNEAEVINLKDLKLIK